MVFDPSSPQIAKTTVWTSPPNPCASSDKALLPLAFWDKSYDGFFAVSLVWRQFRGGGENVQKGFQRGFKSDSNVAFSFIALAPEGQWQQCFVRRCAWVGG